MPRINETSKLVGMRSRLSSEPPSMQFSSSIFADPSNNLTPMKPVFASSSRRRDLKMTTPLNSILFDDSSVITPFREKSPLSATKRHIVNRFGCCNERMCLIKSLIFALFVIFLCQLALLFHDSINLDGLRLALESEIDAEQYRWNDLDRINDLLAMEHDRSSSTIISTKEMTTIYIITPTYYRLSQKADLTRMANTLRLVADIFWLLVEDADQTSDSIAELLIQSRLPHAYIAAKTPIDLKFNESDSNWKDPHGVVQRNAALDWIRSNLADRQRGVVYFGDDDNTYDLRLFDEIRNVSNVGVWPVGLVDELIVETPQLDSHGIVRSFNTAWKSNRPFPIDMAGFGININLIHTHPHANFSYTHVGGYQQSHLLSAFDISIADLEPKANNCTRVYVWRTRTERTRLNRMQQAKFSTNVRLTALEIDAIGLRPH